MRRWLLFLLLLGLLSACARSPLQDDLEYITAMSTEETP